MSMPKVSEVRALGDKLAEVLEEHDYDAATEMSALLICLVTVAVAHADSRAEVDEIIHQIIGKLSQEDAISGAWQANCRSQIRPVAH